MGSFHSDIRGGGIKREARNVRSIYPSLPFVRFLHNFPEATTEKKKYKNSRDSLTRSRHIVSISIVIRREREGEENGEREW